MVLVRPRPRRVEQERLALARRPAGRARGRRRAGRRGRAPGRGRAGRRRGRGRTRSARSRGRRAARPRRRRAGGTPRRGAGTSSGRSRWSTSCSVTTWGRRGERHRDRERVVHRVDAVERAPATAARANAHGRPLLDGAPAVDDAEARRRRPRTRRAARRRGTRRARSARQRRQRARARTPRSRPSAPARASGARSPPPARSCRIALPDAPRPRRPRPGPAVRRRRARPDERVPRGAEALGREPDAALRPAPRARRPRALTWRRVEALRQLRAARKLEPPARDARSLWVAATLAQHGGAAPRTRARLRLLDRHDDRLGVAAAARPASHRVRRALAGASVRTLRRIERARRCERAARLYATSAASRASIAAAAGVAEADVGILPIPVDIEHFTPEADDDVARRLDGPDRRLRRPRRRPAQERRPRSLRAFALVGASCPRREAPADRRPAARSDGAGRRGDRRRLRRRAATPRVRAARLAVPSGGLRHRRRRGARLRRTGGGQRLRAGRRRWCSGRARGSVTQGFSERELADAIVSSFSTRRPSPTFDAAAAPTWNESMRRSTSASCWRRRSRISTPGDRAPRFVPAGRHGAVRRRSSFGNARLGCARMTAPTVLAPRQQAWTARTMHVLRVLRVIAGAEFKLKYSGSALGYVWSIAQAARPLRDAATSSSAASSSSASSRSTTRVRCSIGIVLFTFFADATTLGMSSLVAPRVAAAEARLPAHRHPDLGHADRGDHLRRQPDRRRRVHRLEADHAPARLAADHPSPARALRLHLGVALILSTVFVRLRDIGQVWELALQLMFYASPIIYPIGFLPPWARKLAFLNPFIQVLQDIRAVISIRTAPQTGSRSTGVRDLGAARPDRHRVRHVRRRARTLPARGAVVRGARLMDEHTPRSRSSASTRVPASAPAPDDAQGALPPPASAGRPTSGRSRSRTSRSTIEQGEFFGIIGPNGSGKSTLLKILAGIYRQDAGTVRVDGVLSPFIELGVGFNPELTARDNIRINGTLLGLSRAAARASASTRSSASRSSSASSTRS